MVVAVEQLRRTGRVARRPQHSYHLRFSPWDVQPFAIAPVLPGETLKSALFQTRAVTLPLTSPLIGWWLEQYLFYVKVSDLRQFDELFKEMFLVQGTDISSANYGGTSVQLYTNTSAQVSWVNECLRRIVECYFRDEDEAWTAAVGPHSGIPMAKVNTKPGFMDSLIQVATGTPFDEGGSPQTAAETLHELDRYLDTYEFMRAQQLTNLTYEEWLKMHGIRTTKAQEQKPELIRYVRDWQYPSNTVTQGTGAVTSAVSWALSERADKDRFFTEPGFIFGVIVARPKVYYRYQTGSASNCLQDAIAWLPALLADQPHMSLQEWAHNTGPIRNGNASTGYWFDMRDLFLHGDQFTNFTLAAATGANLVDLPDTAAYLKDYVDQADMDALYSGATAAAGIKADGVLTLNILGKQVDNT